MKFTRGIVFPTLEGNETNSPAQIPHNKLFPKSIKPSKYVKAYSCIVGKESSDSRYLSLKHIISYLLKPFVSHFNCHISIF